MMMNSYLQNDRSRRDRRRLLATTSLVVLLMIIDIISGGVLRHTARSVGAVAWQGGTSVTKALADTGFFATRAMLEDRIRSLTEEVERLRGDSANYAVLKEENERLRELVRLASQAQGITAPVVSSMRSSPYGTFLIKAGTGDGVKTGDVVVAPGGFAVGTVADVGSGLSSVVQIFSPQSSLDAIVGDARVKVEGRGGGNAYARLPHGLSVAEGDVVLAPHLGEKPIGIVGGIASSSSAFSDVYIGLPLSLDSLRYVYVVPQ